MAQLGDVYIKAGHLYDSEQKVLIKNKTIQLRGTTIVSISDWNSIPQNAKIIDLSDYTVLPGLIDAHTHVLFSQTPVDDFAEHSIQTLVMEGDALRALRGAKRAKAYLDVGITSIKDLGNSGLFLDVALRDAIDEGSIAGPRIFASGPIMAAAGGQIYGVPSKQQHIIEQEYRIIKNVEDARNAVREHVNQNVDLIKICADNLPNRTLLSFDEMKAIVQTAHEYNLTVTAHAVTNQSAWNAITAGVDGIEHGFNIADTTLALMAQKKVFLVPTENSRAYMENYAKMVGMGDDEVDWIDYYMENMTKRLQSALDKGVPVLAGSDNYMDVGVSRGVSSRDMFRFYFEAGMKPLDILHAATYLSAVHLNKEKEIGNLIPRAKADIIAVKGDLEGNFLNTLENLVFVMKDGEIYLDKTE
tara:strand:+ start:50330 stop:51574 length:1245 start_codon:yes stop_codon:yes gene_type:complete